MAESTDSNTPPKRYNTRPRTKKSFEVLSSRFSGYVVDTSPPYEKRGRGRQAAQYSAYQNYQRARAVYDTPPLTQPPHHETAPSYFLPREPVSPMRYPAVPDPRFQPPYQVAARPVQQMMPATVDPNYLQPAPYPPQFRPNTMVPPYPGHQPMAQMPYPGPQPMHMAPAHGYAPPPVRVAPPPQPMPHPAYHAAPMATPGYPYQGFVPSSPRQMAPQYPPGPVGPGPVQALRAEPAKPHAGPQMIPIHNGREYLEAMHDGQAVRPGKRRPSTEQVDSYLNAVGEIARDISDATKFDKSLEKYVGRVSIPDNFEFPELHKTVCFDYVIDKDLYRDMVRYFRELKRIDYPLPANATGPVLRKAAAKPKDEAAQAETGEDKPDEESADDPELTFSQLQLDFLANMILIGWEKKIHPITFETCKTLSFQEINPFFSMMTKSNSRLMSASKLQKFRLKSVLTANDDESNHYLVQLSEQTKPPEFALKYQFGAFHANSFFNKRVPIYTTVDFGQTDPSFLFSRKMHPRKAAKSTLHYAKVSRSFQVYVGKLDAYVTLELAKILSERELFQRNATHQLTVHCSMGALPKVLSAIHGKR